MTPLLWGQAAYGSRRALSGSLHPKAAHFFYAWPAAPDPVGVTAATAATAAIMIMTMMKMLMMMKVMVMIIMGLHQGGHSIQSICCKSAPEKPTSRWNLVHGSLSLTQRLLLSLPVPCRLSQASRCWCGPPWTSCPSCCPANLPLNTCPGCALPARLPNFSACDTKSTSGARWSNAVEWSSAH